MASRCGVHSLQIQRYITSLSSGFETSCSSPGKALVLPAWLAYSSLFLKAVLVSSPRGRFVTNFFLPATILTVRLGCNPRPLYVHRIQCTAQIFYALGFIVLLFFCLIVLTYCLTRLHIVWRMKTQSTNKPLMIFGDLSCFTSHSSLMFGLDHRHAQ